MVQKTALISLFDTTKLESENLIIYPLTNETVVDGYNVWVKYEVNGRGGYYKVLAKRGAIKVYKYFLASKYVILNLETKD